MDRPKSTRTQKDLLSVRVQPQSLGCCYQTVITAQTDLKEGDEMLIGIVKGSIGENMKVVG